VEPDGELDRAPQRFGHLRGRQRHDRDRRVQERRCVRRVDDLIAGLDEAPKRAVQASLARWAEIELGFLDEHNDAGDLRLAAGIQRLADGGLSERTIGDHPPKDVPRAIYRLPAGA
jgi:hypothetical protein